MRIALCQTYIEWENKKSNYLTTEKKIAEASQKNVDLFLLPEMSFTGFSMNVALTQEKKYETVEKMAYLTQKYGLSVGFGWVKDCGLKAENHYTVVDQNGEMISDYAKIHPFSYSGENVRFQGGTEVTVFHFDNIFFSTFICYDLRFPEVFQAASKKAGVIIVPANWPKTRREHWKCLLRARAIENQVYIMAVNCVGEINGISYSGDSCVIAPDGEILMEVSNKEDILLFDLQDNIAEYRNRFPVKEDRREKLYVSMLER